MAEEGGTGLMKHLILGFLGCAMLALAGPALADPHADANAADKRGDYAAELAILKPNAEAGQPWAQNNLGNLYSSGHGVAADPVQAVFWYRKAADQGDAGGELNLGQMYEKGAGVAKDKTAAASWLRKAAEQGSVPGLQMLELLLSLIHI